VNERIFIAWAAGCFVIMAASAVGAYDKEKDNPLFTLVVACTWAGMAAWGFWLLV